MKKLLGFLICACVCAVLSTGATGCKKPDKEKEKEKEKDKTAGKKDVTVSGEKTASVKAGESHNHELKVKRGDEATEDVIFVIELDPKDSGVSATADKVAGKDTKGTLKIEAKSDAKPGDTKVSVKSTSKGSKDIPVLVVVVTVPKAKDKVVELPKNELKVGDGKDLTVKQGGKDTAKVAVTLGDDLKKGATVKAWVKDKDDKEAKGVTAAVDTKTLDKSGDASVTASAADDAAPGDYTLTIEVAAEGGMPATATTKIKITVEKKK
jgi:hypothetical protein